MGDRERNTCCRELVRNLPDSNGKKENGEELGFEVFENTRDWRGDRF